MKKIEKARKALGLTQKEFCKYTKIPLSSYGKYVTNVRKIPQHRKKIIWETIERLQDSRVTIAQLLFEQTINQSIIIIAVIALFLLATGLALFLY